LIVERAIGFHAPEVDLLVTPYAGLDGSYLHGTRAKPRKLALEGFIDAIDDDELVLLRDEIWSIINPRIQGSFIQQPFTLTYCPSEDYADSVNIDVVYESGLETTPGAINPNLSLSFIAPNPYFYKTNYEITELGAGSGSVGLPGTHYCGSDGVWHQFRPYDEDAVLFGISNGGYAFYTTATAMYKQALSQLPNGTRTVILNQANVVVRAAFILDDNSFYAVYGTEMREYNTGAWTTRETDVGLHCAFVTIADWVFQKASNNHVFYRNYNSSALNIDFGEYTNVKKISFSGYGDARFLVIATTTRTVCKIRNDSYYPTWGVWFALPYSALVGKLDHYAPYNGVDVYMYGVANDYSVNRVYSNINGELAYYGDKTYNLTQYSKTIDMIWHFGEQKPYIAKNNGVYRSTNDAWETILSATQITAFQIYGTYRAAILSPVDFLITNITAAPTTVVNTGSAETNAVLTFIGKCYISKIAIANDKNPQILCEIWISDASESVVVDTEAGTIISSTRGSLASMLLPGSNMAGFKLQPGANTVQLTAVKTDVNTKFYCSWRNRYLSGKA
jgi:hypothetical protein